MGHLVKCGLNGGKDAGVNGQLIIPALSHEYQQLQERLDSPKRPTEA